MFQPWGVTQSGGPEPGTGDGGAGDGGKQSVAQHESPVLIITHSIYLTPASDIKTPPLPPSSLPPHQEQLIPAGARSLFKHRRTSRGADGSQSELGLSVLVYLLRGHTGGAEPERAAVKMADLSPPPSEHSSHRSGLP